LTTWLAIERTVANQIHSIKGYTAQARIRTPVDLDRAQFHACYSSITTVTLRLAQEHYVLAEKPLKACSGVYKATTGLPCAHQIEDIRGHGGSLLPEDFHKHWYWDRYSEPSDLILDPLCIITHTTSTKRLPSAFEATEPRERLCGRCRLPGHNRNSFKCMLNLRDLHQEFQQETLAIPANSTNSRELHTNSEVQSIAQVALQEFESLSPEPENPPTDTRLIWPGRIELIYQAYLAEKNTWLATNPTVQPAQYRSKRGLQKWSKAACDRRSLRWQLPLKRLNLETETLIEGQPKWTDEEIYTWLDWDQQQEQLIEQQVEAEVVAAGGYGGDSRRGIGHIHAHIEAEVATERSQYRFHN
jgi:hypothetical protein